MTARSPANRLRRAIWNSLADLATSVLDSFEVSSRPAVMAGSHLCALPGRGGRFEAQVRVVSELAGDTDLP